MQFLLCMALLFAARPVLAQEDWEEGLTEARLVGDADPHPVQLPTPQLVKHVRTTPVVLGVTAAIGGGFSLVGAWAMYIARQNYRQRAWLDVSPDTLSEWREQGAWSFWLGVSGAGLLVTSEYFLLPESNSVPGYAWLAGAGGLGLAAVGVGFAVGGSHCSPQALKPGATVYTACMSGTSDAVFGPLLMLSAIPLINLPVTYLLRKAFAGAPESLSFGPGGVSFSGRF
jgi:hypothetical protein